MEKTYLVEEIVKTIYSYRVKADSPHEAEMKVRNDEKEDVEHLPEYDHALERDYDVEEE